MIYAWHVFVAARDTDVGIMMLCAGDGLNTIGNDFAGLERIAHAY